jgi:hypothetical protein
VAQFLLNFFFVFTKKIKQTNIYRHHHHQPHHTIIVQANTHNSLMVLPTRQNDNVQNITNGRDTMIVTNGISKRKQEKIHRIE